VSRDVVIDESNTLSNNTINNYSNKPNQPNSINIEEAMETANNKPAEIRANEPIIHDTIEVLPGPPNQYLPATSVTEEESSSEEEDPAADSDSEVLAATREY
jgi:hypothetical protein